MKPFLIVTAMLLFTGPALAQAPAAPAVGQLGNVRPLSGPPMALALEAAQTAVATCKARGYNVGVAVVDESGGLRVVLGADGAQAADSNGARRAALFSAAQKTPGAGLVERLKTDTELASKLAANRDWNAHEGVLLIKAGDKIIGAIGVEGHPHDAEKDAACAKAGLDKIQSRLK
jgi:uncharacterized protein GlcG (DUF336 family)